ncbi:MULTISPECIES: dTDP-4-dehydrorhamnose 3,5-epimerase family protein [Chloracidobacterium]|jgi:dTDP-4-dehydrorhamnose 3,5-epimerase|uniref:dTDP-4-dehydrorhamnose 3,5-epimerase n=2 Tax=Chloracidobacterium TaxID=458032 RepID=G2LLH8_CHLTF|nr:MULTISPECIES: dTDP-4-dehydrorhamnose 3,5-epimerase family protein [Chloracidobacterium]AEP13774.1 dTDP-4-dehydrorhamnose 3,5-epimerase-like enzyme [Chloracidobacterium thermophilum B]QUV83242.1 dTDP-4-dehydrorhamnose 3,5-epimerase family protein [Chloracidobacterium sp. D]QUV86669.1 dTDP-4-dehydrorhamnose 3,5-epimerase family protein [Chloracidobacterium sp. 2]QUV89786.1 dTDP-4-dehydrorhamnose 3,5-epimerase family protein [Chloracidobacterium sp. S]QUV92821.1 dTDP-4-dehydrorhamnose 3,5-epim
MIDGVAVRPLRQIPDERGKIMHMLRADAPHFERFGEIYFSCVYPGAIKAWHIHKAMTLNYAVIVGRIKLVLYDDREHSPTRGELMELFIGDGNYALVTIPPRIWNGFKGIGTETAIVANCATLPHDPEEIERMDPFTDRIPYRWDIRHG